MGWYLVFSEFEHISSTAPSSTVNAVKQLVTKIASWANLAKYHSGT